jgi:hypothetical protein
MGDLLQLLQKGPDPRGGPAQSCKRRPRGGEDVAKGQAIRLATCRLDMTEVVANDLQTWEDVSSKMRMQVLLIRI